MNNIIDADYRVVGERTLEVIAAEIRTIDNHVCQVALQGAVEIGQRLEEAKSKVGHGNWENWCKENLNYSKSQAERFMKISTEYGNEDSPYLTAISKTSTLTDLSIYKAFRLLQVPENEVEQFANEHDVASLTVKELEAEIKALKDKNSDLERGLKQATVDKEKLAANIETARSELKELQGKEGSDETLQELREKQEEIDKLLEELEKKNSSENRLKERINNFETESQKAMELAKELALASANEKIKQKIEEGKETARKEVEEEMSKLMAIADDATKAKLEAEKKLQASSNEELMKFKFMVNEIQEQFNDALNALDNIGSNDKEQAAKLRNGLKIILGKFQEQL